MKEIKRIKKEELEEIKKFFKRKKNLKIRIKKIFLIKFKKLTCKNCELIFLIVKITK